MVANIFARFFFHNRARSLAYQGRVQQVIGPRFWVIVLDRSAVGHAPVKGPGHFWWITF